MDIALSHAVEQAEAIFETEVASKAPGCSLAVMLNGELVCSKQFGYANLETKTPVTPTTRFRIGSVSKPLTAAGLALLVERKQIDLDAPIQKYVPDFPEKEGIITLRLLAGHLSGIRNYLGTEARSNQPFPNLRSGVKIFEKDPLISPPGAQFSYASYNWNLLGVAMEAAAKQDFLSYIEENVIRPLGLLNTCPDLAGAVEEQRASFYDMIHDGKFFIPPPVDLSFCWPAGGYLSTAEDIVRFGAAHLRPGFLKPESLKLLFTSQTTNSGTQTNYGIGWFIGPGFVHHGGDSAGGVAILLLVPQARLVVAMAANVGHGFLLNLIRKRRVPKDAAKFLFPKEVIALKVAKQFALALKKKG